jgi:hypothetical protein
VTPGHFLSKSSPHALHLASPALLKQFVSRQDRIINARNYLQSNVMRLFWFVKDFCDFCLTSFQVFTILAQETFWPT